MTLHTRTAALLAATLIAAGGAGASEEDGALDARGSGDATGADPTFEDELDGFEDELDGFEDELDGFEDEEPFAEDSESAETDPEESERFWELSGDVSLGSSINYRKHKSASGTQYRGLSRLRSELFLQLDIDLPFDWKLRGSGRGFYDFAYLIDRDEYTQKVLSNYEWDIESQEVWFQGPVFEDLDLKVGRQVVNWGRSDSVRVLDVLNALDLQEPGLVDIEDLRLAASMIRADYYWENWSLTGIAIPELRFDKDPTFGSDFQPVFTGTGSSGLATALGVRERQPRNFHGNTEWAAALMGVFPGWDVSFHFARVWWNRTYLDPNTNSQPRADLLDWTPEARHSRVTLVGGGGNYTAGNWLFKTEVAYLRGLEYTVSDFIPVPGGVQNLPVGAIKKPRIDTMGGIEYYGIDDVVVALEMVNRHIFNFRSDMKLFFAQRNRVETAVRVTADFMNARLHLTAFGLLFGIDAQDGSFVRLEASYDIRDALVAGGGIVLYQKGDQPPFTSIFRNDRLFFHLKYSF